MKLNKVGEKSKAICPFCKELRTTTFTERDVPLSSGKGLVRDVLVAVCDTCAQVVAIPQQSVPRIKETICYSRHALEARIPRHLLDALALVCHELGFSPDCSAVLFRFYLQRISQTATLRNQLGTLAASKEAQGRAGARFSAKLNDELYGHLQDLERRTKLSRTAVVKATIVQMKRDILDRRHPALRRDLQKILRLAA
jgi:hypothetical protein